MKCSSSAVADITYRANVIDGSEIVARLQCASECATLADAWARLVAVDPSVDPRSIEIEIRDADAWTRSLLARADLTGYETSIQTGA